MFFQQIHEDVENSVPKKAKILNTSIWPAIALDT